MDIVGNALGQRELPDKINFLDRLAMMIEVMQDQLEDELRRQQGHVSRETP